MSYEALQINAHDQVEPHVAAPRHSSVDDLISSPGNAPILLSELWDVAHAAYQVVWHAYVHISQDDAAAGKALETALDALMAVRSYTHDLRMVYEVAK